ncbi:MAG: glycosyltransferase family 9 protein, partial [Planctomycetota bacterium]
LGPAEGDRLGAETMRQINAVAPCLTDLSLTEVVGLLSCADAFVGNDSGITHLAGAMGVRTAAIFGPTNPAIYRPVGPRVTVFAGNTESFADGSSTSLQRELLEALTP